jgi:hypothetical protein
MMLQVVPDQRVQPLVGGDLLDPFGGRWWGWVLDDLVDQTTGAAIVRDGPDRRLAIEGGGDIGAHRNLAGAEQTRLRHQGLVDLASQHVHVRVRCPAYSHPARSPRGHCDLDVE